MKKEKNEIMEMLENYRQQQCASGHMCDSICLAWHIINGYNPDEPLTKNQAMEIIDRFFEN